MDQNYELNIDPSAMCRICLAESGIMKTIFCNEIVNGGIVPFPKVFESTTTIKVKPKDGFPEKLCTACRTIICDAYVLKQKSQQNQVLLCSILGITLPVEVEPPNFVAAKMPAVLLPKPVVKSAETQTDISSSVMIASTQTIAETLVTAQTQTAPTVTPELSTSQTQTSPAKKDDAAQLTVITDEPKQRTTSEISFDIDFNDAQVMMKVETTDDGTTELVEIAENEPQDHFEYAVLEQDEPEQQRATSIGEYEENNVDNDDDEGTLVFDGELTDITTTAEYLLDDDDDDDDDNDVDHNDGSDAIEFSALYCSGCLNEFVTLTEYEQHQQHCGAEVPPPKRRRVQQLATVVPANKIGRAHTGGTTARRRDKFCEVCNIGLKQGVTSYKQHMLCHEQSLPLLVESVHYYRCGSCTNVYLTSEQLEQHLIRGSDEDGGCSGDFIGGRNAITSKPFTNVQYLEDRDVVDACQRLYSCTRLHDDLFMCDWCSMHTDESVAGVIDHITKVHFEDADAMNVQPEHYQSFGNQHKCGICGETYATMLETFKHAYFHSTMFQCPYNQCSDVYTKFYQLHQHLERNHMDDMEFGCTHCAAVFTNYVEFRAHLRTECQERTLACEMCEKKFFSKSTLAIHRKYHFNDKRYCCSFCSKRFTQSGDLKTHERIHTGDKPYKCKVCDKAFRSTGNRKDHMSVHEELKRFVCTYCDLQCKSERTLRGHLTLHTNSKKFQCDQCRKEFHRAYHLKMHKRVHASEDMSPLSVTFV